MYYIQESHGNGYTSLDENVVRFSESKEELEIECERLWKNYNNHKTNWKLAKEYFKKLEVISNTEFQFNSDNKTGDTASLKNQYMLKHQTNYPIPNNIREFLLFEDGLVHGVFCEPDDCYYNVKEVTRAKYQ